MIRSESPNDDIVGATALQSAVGSTVKTSVVTVNLFCTKSANALFFKKKICRTKKILYLHQISSDQLRNQKLFLRDANMGMRIVIIAFF